MNIRIGIGSDRGLREHMEDEHATYEIAAREFLSGEVYDGHGGRQAAQLAAEMLTPHFLHSWQRDLERPAGNAIPLALLLRVAYCDVDRFILDKGMRSGTTAATFYIMAERFLAANAGDTRIVIGTKGGASQLTIDHKPNLPEEIARIENLGGQVITLDIPRVMGMLAVSRSLGDGYLKPFIGCEPRVVEGHLGAENDYAIIACDGVWDVLQPEETMKLARKAGDPQAGAERIKIRALEKGSTDNITVLVLDLRGHTKRLQRKLMEITAITDTATEQNG
jgi:serine/threonine protein phosphatase PrpC